MNELTIIAVTARFAIALDEQGRRHRAMYRVRPAISVGQTLTKAEFDALAFN